MPSSTSIGWSPVSGYDSEPAAIDAAADNARANGVEIELTRLNVREHPAPDVPTIVANLTAALLHAVVERLTAAPRTLVCSGLLTSEADAVSAALASRGLQVVERRRQGDWTALLCRSPAAANRHRTQ